MKITKTSQIAPFSVVETREDVKGKGSNLRVALFTADGLRLVNPFDGKNNGAMEAYNANFKHSRNGGWDIVKVYAPTEGTDFSAIYRMMADSRATGRNQIDVSKLELVYQAISDKDQAIIDALADAKAQFAGIAKTIANLEAKLSK